MEISLRQFMNMQAQEGTYIEALGVISNKFVLMVHLKDIETPGIEDDDEPANLQFGHAFVACEKCISEAKFVTIVDEELGDLPTFSDDDK